MYPKRYCDDKGSHSEADFFNRKWIVKRNSTEKKNHEEFQVIIKQLYF